LIKPTLPSYW